MTDRTAQILEAAIQEFINTGDPVSSGLLYDQYDFGIKPAMIRLELDELEDAGYLEQPHHSAGRVPTNSGYEFFAKRMLGMNTTEISGARSGVVSAKQNDLHLMLQAQEWPDLLNELSAQLGLLSVAADLARESVYKAGLQHLIDHLDWQDQSGIRSVIHDFEEVDERAPRAAEHMGIGPQIFIGKKSPLTTSDNLSVVGGNYQIGDATISIFAIGPKRMDYKKVIRIFKNL
jgi:transcriptional regulator of heat shock response